MKPIRGAMWLVPLAVGCMALPPQSQSYSKSTDNAKAIKTPLSNVSTVGSNSNSGGSNDQETIGSIGSDMDDRSSEITANDRSNEFISVSVSRPLAVSATVATDPFTALSSLPSAITRSTASVSPFANRDSSTETIEVSSTSSLPPISSIVDMKTELGTTSTTTITMTTNNRSTSTTTRTTIGDTWTSTSSANSSSSTNVGSSSFPTEASSRTIASSQDAGGTFLPSLRKSTTGFNEFTTTPASVSSKETRESPGKIRPQIKLTTNYTSLGETGVRLPEGASAALTKPTKYHYYPHNQHIYLLPECAVQQVCNAVYVRLNFTQPLCACPGRYRDPCSASLDSDDLHTTELVTDPRTKALTLVKTCEPVAEMRECRTPRDWSLLALQNVRTGKSHYLVICRCPDANILEGPMSHDQPTYASVPGIRVYGMMCVQGNRRGRPLRYTRSLADHFGGETNEDRKERSSFPWYKVRQLLDTAVWD